MVYLYFVDCSVALNVSGWTNDFFCALSELVREVLGGSHIPLFELTLLHAVADEQIVRYSSLVELDVVFEILVFLFVEQVLLGSLWNVIIV